MRRPSRVLALAVALPALLLSGTQPAAAAPQYDRISLLAADSDYLYWGVDPFDPELGVGTLNRTCGANYVIPVNPKPCLVGTNVTTGTRTYNLYFLPGSTLDEDVTWDSASPLRFHIEGAINTFGAPYAVKFLLQKGPTLVASPAATQVSPGVWEGTITSGSPLLTTGINLMGIRVETQAPVATIDLRLRGATYLQLPRSVSAHAVPDLGREDTYEPQPTSFASATRSFTFNDANWAVRSFTGRTGAARTFDFTLDRKAEILFAWVEVFDSPFLHDVKRGRSPDAEKLRQGAGLTLSSDGIVLDHTAAGGSGLPGLGTAALSVLDVTPLPLTLTVDSANEAEENSVPFTVYVLEIRGDRTLATMRWSFLQQQSLRVPIAATCPGSAEPVPTTDKVRSVGLDLDWDTEATGLGAWTFRFDLPEIGSFACGESGTGDRLRLTMPPAERVWYLGATPAYHGTFVSAYDTVFEMSARYTYSPPAA